jgi:hypothetical protein
MALADFWQVKVWMEYGGALDVLNAYYVNAVGAMSEPDELAERLVPMLVTPFRGIQHSSLAYRQIDVVNLASTFVTGSFSLVGTFGTGAGQPLPRFLAWGFRFNRQAAGIRHGYKRICGVDENMISGSVVDSVVLNTINTTIIPALRDGTVEGDKLHVIKRIKYTTPEGNEAWRLPTSDGELDSYEVSSVVFQGLTTQNTRKR